MKLLLLSVDLRERENVRKVGKKEREREKIQRWRPVVKVEDGALS